MEENINHPAAQELQPLEHSYPVEVKQTSDLTLEERTQINQLITSRLKDEYGEVDDPIEDLSSSDYPTLLWFLAKGQGEDSNKVIGTAALGNVSEVSYLSGDNKYGVLNLSAVAVAENNTGKGIGTSLVYNAVTKGPKEILKLTQSQPDSEERIAGIQHAVVYMESNIPALNKAAIKGAESYGQNVEFTSPDAQAACTPRKVSNVDVSEKLVEVFFRDSRPALPEELLQYGVNRPVANRVQTDAVTQIIFPSNESAEEFGKKMEEAYMAVPGAAPLRKPSGDYSGITPEIYTQFKTISEKNVQEQLDQDSSIKVEQLPSKTQTRIAFQLNLSETA